MQKRAKRLRFGNLAKKYKKLFLQKNVSCYKQKNNMKRIKKKNTYIRAPSGDYIIEKRVLLQSSSIDNQS